MNLGSRITLWCDGSDAGEKENQPPTKKRTEGSDKPEKTEKKGSKRDAAEEELKEIVDQLKANNPTLTFPQIRLCGKMIQAGQYDNYEMPPNIQLIRGCPVPAKPKKESVVELIAGAASAVVKAIQQGNASSENLSPSHGELHLRSSIAFEHHMFDEAVWKTLNDCRNFWKKEYCLSKSFLKSRFFVEPKVISELKPMNIQRSISSHLQHEHIYLLYCHIIRLLDLDL